MAPALPLTALVLEGLAGFDLSQLLHPLPRGERGRPAVLLALEARARHAARSRPRVWHLQRVTRPGEWREPGAAAAVRAATAVEVRCGTHSLASRAAWRLPTRTASCTATCTPATSTACPACRVPAVASSSTFSEGTFVCDDVPTGGGGGGDKGALRGDGRCLPLWPTPQGHLLPEEHGPRADPATGAAPSTPPRGPSEDASHCRGSRRIWWRPSSTVRPPTLTTWASTISTRSAPSQCSRMMDELIEVCSTAPRQMAEGVAHVQLPCGGGLPLQLGGRERAARADAAVSPQSPFAWGCAGVTTLRCARARWVISCACARARLHMRFDHPNSSQIDR